MNSSQIAKASVLSCLVCSVNSVTTSSRFFGSATYFWPRSSTATIFCVATGFFFTNSWLATNSDRVYEICTFAPLFAGNPETVPEWSISVVPVFNPL